MDTHTHINRRHALAGIALTASAGYALARGASLDDKATAPAATAGPANTKAQAGTLPNGAGFYRLTMGPVTIASVADGGGSMPGSPFPLWGANASKDAVDAALKQDFLPLEGTTFHFNSTVIKVGTEVYVFDTGNGAGGGPSAGKLVSHLAHLGIAPADVTAVILSHLHGDHIGGLTTGSGDSAQLTFPKARYLLTKAEHDFWSTAGAADIKGNLPDGFKTGAIAGAGRALAMIKARSELLTGDAKISEHLTVRPAPGHTPGHLMLDITGGGERLLACADLVHHFSLSFRRPDLHIQFDTDPVAGAQTRLQVLAQAAAERTLILGYHMPFPGLGHVRNEATGRTNGTYSWAPVAWEW
jgi:glyoxylase-like metal-dependent hydrolase (beta-lactamase superfamily II)